MMDEVAEAKEKWIRSADAWIAGMRTGDTNRTHLLDPAMLEILGEVRGLEALDVGCGEGRFCRMLSMRGAHTTGCDLTSSLIAEARRQDPGSPYVVSGAEDLPFADNSFDLSISYIVLVDVADFRRAIREMARVTKPGGRLVVANLSPFASTSETGWYRDADRRKLHFPVDRYFEERALRLSWGGMSVINWHRPLEAYMSAYLECGLMLERFVEPKPSEAALADRPEMIDEARIALFNVMVWRKD